MPTNAYRDTAARVRLITRDGFASEGAMDALQQLLNSLGTLQDVHQGIPTTLKTRVSASIALGGGTLTDVSGGLLRRIVRISVLFYYRVDSQESDVEVQLANLVDRFIIAFYRTRNLNGLYGAFHNMSLDLSPADTPEYQVAAGPEYRIYPIVVQGTQQQLIG
jgi:hypothetical protein